GLAETLEQPDAAAIRVEGVHVVDDDELVAVAVELHVHAERRGVALDPAGLAVQDRPDGATLGQSPGADQDQERELPGGEGPEIRLQPVIGRDLECLLGASPMALGPGRHGPYLPVTQFPKRLGQGDSIWLRLLDSYRLTI